MANPKDPNELSLAGSTSPGGNKPDFSKVQGGSDSVANPGGSGGKPDFSNVQGGSDSVPETGGGGGGEQSYTIEKGDTLSSVSKRFYGSASHWKKIYEANRDTIENPDLIYPGQTIKIPAAESE